MAVASRIARFQLIAFRVAASGEVVEHRRVEPLVAGQLLRGGVGVEHPPTVGLILERAAERLDQARPLLLLLERLPVPLEHDRVHEVPPGGPRGGEHQLLGAAAVPPEASGDQQEQAQAEEEANLPLEARLAEDVGDRPVSHALRRVRGHPPRAVRA